MATPEEPFDAQAEVERIRTLQQATASPVPVSLHA